MLASLRVRIGQIARAWPLVAAVSPSNWSAEVRRLTEARAAGRPAVERFVYGPARPDRELPGKLLDLASALDEEGDEEAAALGRRARELAMELGLILALDTPDFVPLARLRFACSPGDDARAAGWAALRPEPDGAAVHRSDDEDDAESLVTHVRAGLAARQLPARVVLRDDLPSLAACGDGTVIIARHRMLSARVARRTTLHELDGHVRPWWRRQTGQVVADADRGESDLEEGRALRLEQEAGLLDDARKQELGRRHLAAMMAHEGAPLDAIVDRLEGLGMAAADAVRMAARARRGGGLGRERVYLPALWGL